MKYFKQLDLIRYNNQFSRNLLQNGQIIDKIFKKYQVFYDYKIKEQIKPDYLAQEYYGDYNNVWIIYLSNKVINPYNFWPLDFDDFIKYIESKYEKSYQLLSNEIYYYKYTGIDTDSESEILRKNWKMSPETYNNLPVIKKSGWTLETIYDYEYNINEVKRNIKLLSNKYTNQITSELGEIFNGR